MFHVRRRPADYHSRKRKKKLQHKWNQHHSSSNELLEYRYEDGLDGLPLPLFLELNSDGTEICGGAAKRHRLHPNETEVGCERKRSHSQYLQLVGPSILARHCVIANSEGVVTITPCSRDSETHVNGLRIYETTLLQNGSIVKFGRFHCFRFLDPYFEERIRQRRYSLKSIHEFAVCADRTQNFEYHHRGADAILPAVLEVGEETEARLLKEMISAFDADTTTSGFELAPAYCLYLMARYRASTHFRPDLTPTERALRLTLTLARVACAIRKAIQSELSNVMPLFFADEDDTTPSLLAVLDSAMSVFRACRVNAALTVQLFSHLFHFVDVWAFNRLIAPNTNYCSRVCGSRLKSKLGHIEAWAEAQGLQMSTDTHLAKIKQAAHLLQASKYTADDLASLSSSCFLLNSVQLRELLRKYQLTCDEPSVPRELVEKLVEVAESLADQLARSDGRGVKLEEEPEFASDFVLPIDGYSCEVMRGLPSGLLEFVAPLQRSGLCRLSTQPTSTGSWTVHMQLPNVETAVTPASNSAANDRSVYFPGPREPDIQTIKLHKWNNGIGLSIVAAKGAGQNDLGIYVKSVVTGGAAELDGRLQAGDQLLKVDDRNLVGIAQEKAAEYLVRTGPIVTLQVAKQAAIYHGLATLLSQPSSITTPEAADGGRARCEMPSETCALSTITSSQRLRDDEEEEEEEKEEKEKEGMDDPRAPTGQTSESSCGAGAGGGCSQTPLQSHKLAIQPRYGNFLHPDHALLHSRTAAVHQPPHPSEGDGGACRRHSTRSPPAPTPRPGSFHASQLRMCQDMAPCYRPCGPRRCNSDGDLSSVSLVECETTFDSCAGRARMGNVEMFANRSPTSETGSSGDAVPDRNSRDRARQQPRGASDGHQLSRVEFEAIVKELEAASSVGRDAESPALASPTLTQRWNWSGPGGADMNAARRPGRVAELTRRFSELGSIRAAAATVASRLHRRSVSLDDESDGRGATPQPPVDEAEAATDRRIVCRERRRSFAGQHAVFCRMRNVDELDRKRRRREKRGDLYRYASMSDLSDGGVDRRSPSSMLSFDDLLRNVKSAVVRSPPPFERRAESPSDDRSARVDYDRLTCAMRHYLASKELLLKRMRSNSVDTLDGVVGARDARSHRTCFGSATCAWNANATPSPRSETRPGAIPDRRAAADACHSVFKENIRRVRKGCGQWGGRRARKWRRAATTRRSVVPHPADIRIIQKMRCLSLDAHLENHTLPDDCAKDCDAGPSSQSYACPTL